MTENRHRLVLLGLAILSAASALAKAWAISVVFAMLLLAVIAHRSRLSED